MFGKRENKTHSHVSFHAVLKNSHKPPNRDHLLTSHSVARQATSTRRLAMPALSRTPSCVDIDFTLRQQFGKTNFRPNQREIITAALEGCDVFVQAATSFGKSLCFQLPAVIDHGSRYFSSADPLDRPVRDLTNRLQSQLSCHLCSV